MINSRLLAIAILLFAQGCLPSTPSAFIDLTNVCHQENAKPPCVDWFVKKGFSPELAALDRSDPQFQKDEWIKPGKIDIWVNKVFQHPPDQDFAQYSFVTWFDLPNDIIKESEIPGILLGEIGEAFSIYVNGHKIVTEGVVENNQVVFHRTVRGVSYPIRPDYLKEKNNQLLIHLSGDPRFEHTGFYVTQDFRIAKLESLIYHRRDLAGIILIFIYLIVGIYHLLLYLKRKQEVSYRDYAIFSLLIFIYLATRHDLIFELPLDTIVIQKVELSVLFLLIASILNFIEQKLNQRFFLVSKFYMAFLFIIAIVSPFVPIHIAEHILKVWQISTFFFFPFSMFILIHAKIKKKPDAGRLLFGMLILFMGGIFDIVDSLILNTGITVAKYAMAFFVLGIGATLANRFMQVHNEVEELNKNLEKKVSDRTKELQNTLETVQELKVRQDGDYFLTSLLLKPLNGNYSNNQDVEIEVYLKQKKEFQFKHWNTEIGGDICLAYDIELRSKQYVCFINADAMGKSIQGAGGALVAGVVFKSIVTRTQLSTAQQNRLPEKWLKDCFIELQNTFISFEGSMLLSAVIGLIDTQTGFTWFINAEHPFPVLYKDHEAGFLGVEHILRKIGIEEIDKKLSIQTVKLEANDVLYLGSDGRDDIIVDWTNDQRIINEDESMFRMLVEKTNGVLARLKEALKKTGELTDDLSLMRISYKEDAPIAMDAPPLEIVNRVKELENASDVNASQRLAEIKTILDNHPLFFEASLAGALIASQSNDHHTAKEFLERCIHIDPGNTDTYSKLIFECKKCRDFEAAIDYGEAMRLRDRQNVRNLIALADSYRLANQPKRALKILQEIGEEHRTDSSFMKLQKLIQK